MHTHTHSRSVGRSASARLVVEILRTRDTASVVTSHHHHHQAHARTAAAAAAAAAAAETHWTAYDDDDSDKDDGDDDDVGEKTAVHISCGHVLVHDVMPGSPTFR